MILTVKELLVAVDSGALDKLAKQPIPVAGAWKLRRLLRLLGAEYRDAHEQRMRLFTDQNSVPVRNKEGARQIKPEHVAEFEAQPLFAQTVEIPADCLTMEDLDGASISVADMELLQQLFAQ